MAARLSGACRQPAGRRVCGAQVRGEASVPSLPIDVVLVYGGADVPAEVRTRVRGPGFPRSSDLSVSHAGLRT